MSGLARSRHSSILTALTRETPAFRPTYRPLPDSLFGQLWAGVTRSTPAFSGAAFIPDYADPATATGRQRKPNGMPSVPRSSLRDAVYAVASAVDPELSDSELEAATEILLADPATESQFPVGLRPVAQLLVQLQVAAEPVRRPRRSRLARGLDLSARLAGAIAVVLLVAFYTAAKVGALPSGIQNAAHQIFNVPLASGTTLAEIDVHSGPGTSYPVTSVLPAHVTVTFACVAQGTAVIGPYGNETIWDKLASGGYVSDAWIYTGTDSPIAPPCPLGNRSRFDG